MISDPGVEDCIVTVRRQRVILDSDLARLYGVETKALNRAVKRNAERFPEDFMFQVTSEELNTLRYQSGTSKRASRNRPQAQLLLENAVDAVIAFTEYGALQAANILNSPRAVRMSVFVIRAFVKMRETLLGTRELAKKLAALEKQLTGRLDTHEVAIVHVLQELMQILSPPPPPPGPPKPRIG